MPYGYEHRIDSEIESNCMPIHLEKLHMRKIYGSMLIDAIVRSLWSKSSYIRSLMYLMLHIAGGT